MRKAMRRSHNFIERKFLSFLVLHASQYIALLLNTYHSSRHCQTIIKEV